MNYFDQSQLNDQQRAVIEIVLADLMRSNTFRQGIQRAYEQYGTIHIAESSFTQAKLLGTPPTLVIDFEDIESASFPSPDNNKQNPFTIHRVIAHEVGHFVDDRAELTSLLFRVAADEVQGDSDRAYSRHSNKYYTENIINLANALNYTNPDALIDDLMAATNPLSVFKILEIVEPNAITFANDVMAELHNEPTRTLDLDAYFNNSNFLSFGAPNPPLLCKLDTTLQITGGETVIDAPNVEPCAYAYIPGKQPSLAR